MSLNVRFEHLQRHGPTGILTNLLADQFVLSLKALKNHWNVGGPTFNDLHEFLWRHHSSLNAMMDTVARRIRAVGSHAPGTMAEFLDATELQEQPGSCPNAVSMLADLVSDHETVIRRLHGDAKRCAELFNDPGSADLLTVMSRQHEYLAWMLRSLLAQHESAARSAAISVYRRRALQNEEASGFDEARYGPAAAVGGNGLTGR